MLYIDQNCAEDPTFHLKQLADVQGIASTKVKYLALGVNNGRVAIDLLDTAFIRGQVFNRALTSFWCTYRYLDEKEVLMSYRHCH